MYKAPRVLGWAHTKFGRLQDHTLQTLVETVSLEAISHAKVDPSEIDEVVISHFNQGMDAQGFPSSLPIEAVPALRFKPATRVENACAGGSAAVHMAARSIDAGDARCVLVIGVEKMTSSAPDIVRQSLVSASHVATQARSQDSSFAGLFAEMTRAYFERFGEQSSALARIAAKNHKFGSKNPLAHIQKDLGFEFCNSISEHNPMVAAPLKRTDCSLVSDGAAALVIARSDSARADGFDVRLHARAQINDRLPFADRDMTQLEGCKRAWRKVLTSAGITLDDLDFIETHDCFTIAELMQYEAMGLAEPGRGFEVLEDGMTDLGGRLPVNVSGGLKSKGHPIGATGVSMHVVAAAQLAGEFAGETLPNAEHAGIFNMGGAGVANYCSILARVS